MKKTAKQLSNKKKMSKKLTKKNVKKKNIKKKGDTKSKKQEIMITENCSPYMNHIYPNTIPNSCYNEVSLIKMRDLWNERHPDTKIGQNSGKEIWNELRKNMKKTCNRETCWLNQNFIHNQLGEELMDTHFAPKAPKEWKRNPREWLSSVDITNVMRQYESAYPDFEFIGPSPINFEHRYVDNTCVWMELCIFQLINYIRANKNKIGIIFNTDPDYKDGSHWIALYIDIKRKLIYYFDSNGNIEPKEVNLFIDKIVKQGKELGIRFKRDSNHPFRHQEKNTECGMYCLYFIIELLTNNKEISYFKNNKIADHCMENMRKVYFN